MPATAEDIARQRGIEGFTVERLVEPGLNIDFGAFYLASMLRRFGEPQDDDWRTSIDRAAAAYNAGPGSVGRWLSDASSLPGETERYRRYVGGMWNERHAASSPTYAEWLLAGGWRLVDPDGAPPEAEPRAD
jgi:soluble lytic murein transglycosylase-like protein